jgi:hypothetical protein
LKKIAKNNCNKVITTIIIIIISFRINMDDYENMINKITNSIIDNNNDTIVKERISREIENKKRELRILSQTDAKQKFPFIEVSKIRHDIYFGSYFWLLTNLEEFKSLNIDIIINCAEEIVHENTNLIKKYANYCKSCVNFGNKSCILYDFKIIRNDTDSFSLNEHMDGIVTIITKCIKGGKKIFIHCDYGICRSPTLLVYFLMCYKGYSYEKSYEIVKKTRNMIEISDDYCVTLEAIDESNNCNYDD